MHLIYLAKTSVLTSIKTNDWHVKIYNFLLRSLGKKKEGHKKGIAHAMTLSIKQLQRRALKKENKNTMAASTSTSELQQQNVHTSASDNESQGTSHGDSDEDDNIFL